MNAEKIKNLNLPPSSETGRYFVYSKILNRTFCIEPIDNHPDNIYHGKFGDINPATKKVEGNYGDKHTGGIDMKDSIITEDNGFKDIQFLMPGHSPEGYITYLENQFMKNQSLTSFMLL